MQRITNENIIQWDNRDPEPDEHGISDRFYHLFPTGNATPLEIAKCDKIPIEKRIWALFRPEILGKTQFKIILRKIVDESVEQLALHCDIPLVELWAKCWLKRMNRSFELASNARDLVDVKVKTKISKAKETKEKKKKEEIMQESYLMGLAAWATEAAKVTAAIIGDLNCNTKSINAFEVACLTINGLVLSKTLSSEGKPKSDRKTIIKTELEIRRKHVLSLIQEVLVSPKERKTK